MANEKRLIDANALNWGRCPADGKLVSAWLNEAPTVDAVEVVRCKDCKYWNEENKWCYKHSHYFNDGVNWLQWERFESDDFCSHGERKGAE